MVEYTANEPCNPFELAEILPGAQRRLFDQSHLRHPGYTNFLTSGDAFIYKIDKQTSPQAVFDMVGEAIIGWTKSIQELKSSKQVSPAIRVSLAELARVSGFYVPYLSTLFKKEVGENISTYLLRLKIKTAQEMLLNTKLSTKEIGFYLNFSSRL